MKRSVSEQGLRCTVIIKQSSLRCNNKLYYLVLSKEVFYYLFVSLLHPSKIWSKSITKSQEIIVWHKSVKWSSHNVYIQRPFIHTKSLKLYISKMTMINCWHLFPPCSNISCKPHLARKRDNVSISTHIQVKSIEFIFGAKIIHNSHERGTSSLWNSVVEYHEVIIFTFPVQSCIPAP